MTTFQQEFSARIKSIFERGEAAGLNVTELCRRTKIARATPDRWRKGAPLSVQLVDKMEAEVVKAEKAHQASN